MIKNQSRLFDAAWLFALGLAPAFAGGALIVLMFLTLAGIIQRLRGYPGEVSAPVQLVAAVFILYFVYFYLNGAILGGDVWAPYATMKGNIPLLIVALYGLLGVGRFHRFSAYQLGVWSSCAVHLTALVVVVLYLLFYFFPLVLAPIKDTIWAYGAMRLELLSRNPLMFASLLTTVSFLSLLGFEDKNQKERLLALAAVPVGLLVVLIGAQTRGVLVLCIPLGLLVVWYLRISFRKALSFLSVALVVMVAAVAFIDPIAAMVDPIIGRVTAGWVMLTSGGQIPEYSLLHRVRMFQLGWEAISESPWWGYGYQNRFEVIIPLMEPTDNFRYGHLHNAIFNHWVAGGLPGLAILVMVLGLPLILMGRYSDRSRNVRFLAILVTIMMVGTGLYTAILGHFVHTTFYGMLILTLALLTNASPSKRGNSQVQAMAANKPHPVSTPRAPS